MSSSWTKLAPRTFRIEWDLHAWCGIIASNFVFVIFFCGIFALIHDELHAWQDPSQHVPRAAHDAPSPSFDELLVLAKKHVAIPRGANIGMAFEGTHVGYAWIDDEPTKLDKDLKLELATGAILPEHTRLADELYYMHFFYRVPGGQELAGVVAVALFIASISGLLMHLKDLKRQLWSFRPRLRLRFSASDAHKVLGVFGLPFLMMFAWSGALLALWGLALSGVTGAVFQGDPERASRARGEEAWERAPAHEPAEMASLDALVGKARVATNAGDAQVAWLGTQLYGDQRALTRVYFEGKGFDQEPYAVLDARTGAVIRTQSASPPSAGFERVMYALHYASYGGTLINFVYVLLALAVCGVVITGNLIWLERRDKKRAHIGNRLLERFSVGVCAGCVLAAASYFAANRALPDELAARDDWEFRIYLVVWGVAALSTFMPKWTARQHAVALSTLASAVFGAVVLGDVLLLDVNIVTAFARDVPRVLIIECLLLLLSASAGVLAWSLASRSKPDLS